MTSRPEVPIRHGFCRIPDLEHHSFVLHNISPSIIDHDISLFLRHEFRLLKNSYSFRDDWPGDQQVNDLCRSAAGLFIWASTAFRFIKEGRRLAPKRLSLLIAGNYSYGGPEKHLNDIYLTVLENSIGHDYLPPEIEEITQIFKEIVGTVVVLFSPLSTLSLATLLRIPQDEIIGALDDLHSILDVPQDQTQPIRLHHPSFRDFLLDQKRCTNPFFQVDEKGAHKLLADCCLRLMSEKLEKDICKLQSPGALAIEVKKELIAYRLPSELQYACLYWVRHLQRSQTLLRDDGPEHQFLQNHILQWFEALSLMQNVSEGLLAIISLSTMVEVQSGRSSELEAFLYDAKRFILYNGSAVEEAPLQLYWSALIFAPKESVFRAYLSTETSDSIHRFPEVSRNSPALQLTLEGRDRIFHSVAFSPNDKIIASAEDHSVCLWDTVTGALRQKLISEETTRIAFSPDSTLFVGAWSDIQLWDVATGVLRKTFEPDDHCFISAIAFSPNGQLLGYGCGLNEDQTMPRPEFEIRLLDVSTGTLQHIFAPSAIDIPNDIWVCTVAFSPDGQWLASSLGSYYGYHLVMVWNMTTMKPTTEESLTQDIDYRVDWVTSANISPNFKVVVFAENSKATKAITIWNMDTGRLIHKLEAHSRKINKIAVSSDSNRVVSSSEDHTIKIWDAITGSCLQTLRGHLDSVLSVAFSSDGRLVASCSSDKTVRIWDVSGQALKQTHDGDKGSIMSMGVSRDGNTVISGLSNGLVQVWDVKTGALRQTLGKSSDVSVSIVLFSQDGKWVASGFNDASVIIWMFFEGTLHGEMSDISVGKNICPVIAFSPDSKLVAIMPQITSQFRIINLATGDIDKYEIHGRSIHRFVDAVAFCAHNNHLALFSSEDLGTSVTLCDATKTAEPKTACCNTKDQDYNIQGVPEGSHRSTDTECYIKPFNRFNRHETISALALSKDGQLIGISYLTKVIDIIDATSGELRQQFSIDTLITKFSFSDDGEYLETNRGLVEIPDAGDYCALSRNIFLEERWITRDGEKILWLPPDYRVAHLIISSGVIVLGHTSGRVTFMQLR